MKIEDLLSQAGQWLDDSGPDNDVVVSSRVRIARNLAGMPFLSKCSSEQRCEIEKKLSQQILQTCSDYNVFYVDLAASDELKREFLVERHLISKQHAKGTQPRGVVISQSEDLAVMINEEDHLRMQVLRSGLRLSDALDEAMKIDDKLEDHLDFAFHSKYGYLTACPTNVGTGLRISIMLHLPALKMTGDIEKVFNAANDMKMAIRGFYGEGTEASGDLFQISNQTTLGKSEQEIIDELTRKTLPGIIEYERKSRAAILDKQRVAIEDKIVRAMAILGNAKLISTEETMYLMSIIRWGKSLDLIDNIDLKTINDIYIKTQPAHLQLLAGKAMPPAQRAEARASYIRSRLDRGK